MTVSGGFGITILKPSHQSAWSQWLLGKQNPDITPPNLRNRSWHDFPRIEVQVHIHILYMYTQANYTLKHFLSIAEEEPRSSIRYRHGTRFDSEREVWGFCSTASTCQGLP